MGSTARADRLALLAPGARLGRYHLLERLAIGGMAELHVACAEGLAGFQKVVVLKRVLPNLAQDEDFIAMFLNEARLAANLDHPNLVQVMDIGQEAGEYFYVMEYVHGQNVRELLAAAAKRGEMPIEVALTIVMAVATGLHHAHERVDLDGRPLGLVHRDVSPANVLVSYDGAVKVTDFGIAKASARSTETIGGAMKGKIGYMSPEQCRGEPVDRRSDIFALGILLFELTTTERLFYADNDFAILNKVLQGRFEPPSRRVPGYPEELENIVLRALAPRPDDRFATAEALLRDLETFAHEAHLRCTTAALADWMHDVFGRPPFPRVELLPPRPDDPLERIPTLVLAGDSMSRADPDAVTRFEPPSPLPPEPSARRSRTPAVLGLAGLTVALGLGIAWWAAVRVQPDAAEAPNSRGLEVEAPAPETAAEMDAERPPAADADRAVEAEPTPDANPAALQPSSSPQPDQPEPPETKPAFDSSRGANGAKKKRPAKKRGSGREPTARGDIDALYPVKG